MSYNYSPLSEDDPTNASGLGTPAIIRGTVHAHLCNGIVIGSGQVLATRQNNATVLQNAINYANTNGKYFEIEGGIYEISSSTGLTISYPGSTTNGFVWRGSKDAQIVQYYNTAPGAPILSIGDSTGVNTSQHIDLHGISLSYGNAQTSSMTSANALQMFGLFNCHIGDINIYGTPYRSIVCGNGTSGTFCFSNRFENISMFSTVQDYIYFNAPSSTGNTWDNLYMGTGGVGTYNSIAGSFINYATSVHDQLWSRVNCEWTSCQYVFTSSTNISFGNQFLDLHLEGIQFTGASPAVFNLATATLNVSGFEMQDCLVLSANISSGTCCIVRDWVGGAGLTLIENLMIFNNNSGAFNTTFAIQSANSGPLGDDVPQVQIINMKSRDSSGTGQLSGHCIFDSHMPIANFAFPTSCARYVYGPAKSLVEYAVIPVSATYTHYGQHENATIVVPASITSFNLTLSNLAGASGTLNTRTGNTVRVHRNSGTASGTLTVKDDAGTTLSTNTTANADLWYVFNGTHYVTATPVS